MLTIKYVLNQGWNQNYFYRFGSDLVPRKLKMSVSYRFFLNKKQKLRFLLLFGFQKLKVCFINDKFYTFSLCSSLKFQILTVKNIK